MNICVTKISDEFHVSLTGVETREEVESQLDGCEELIHFCRLDNEYREYSENCAAFDAIEALLCLESIREVFEKIITEIYRLGR